MKGFGSRDGMGRGIRVRANAARLLVLFCLFLSQAAPPEAASSGPLADALEAHLRGSCPWPEIEIGEITVSEPVADARPSRILIERNPPGRIAFVAEFAGGKRITGTASVRAYDRIVVSARAFRKGHVLQDDDVYIARMDVTRIPKGTLRDTEAVVGKTLSRQLGASVPVVDTAVSDKPVVKRGHRVVLVAESSSFRITTYGELKSESRVGSPVKVLNLQSKKVVSGVLVDENTVKVDF